MENNEVLDADFNLDADSDKTTIELMSLAKFVLLCTLSLGLYGTWWMYKSWKFFKEKDNLDIMPAARAIFAIFFTYSLFEKIQNYAKSNNYINSYSSTVLFILFLILNFSSKLSDPYWLISLVAFVCLIPPFQALNFAISNSDRYRGVEVNRFNYKQIIVVVIGVIFWILLLIGLFFLVEEL